MHFLVIFWQKKCLFGSKTVLLWQEVHYYMVYIVYFTELNLQICDYTQKRRICRENCKYAFDENIHGHFCPDERLPNSDTLYRSSARSKSENTIKDGSGTAL